MKKPVVILVLMMLTAVMNVAVAQPVLDGNKSAKSPKAKMWSTTIKPTGKTPPA